MGSVVGAVAKVVGLASMVIPGAQWMGYLAMGLSVVSAFIGDSNKKKGSESSSTDNKLTLKSTIASRKLAYGEVMLSGPMALKTTTGNTKEYLHIIVSLAAHRVTEFLEVWYDDTLSTATRLSGYQRTKLHDGSILQEADSDLTAEVGEWSTAHRGRGIAYIYSRLKYNATAWPNGIQNIKVVLRGKRVYDPRRPVISIANTDAGEVAVLQFAAAHGLIVGDEVFIIGHSGLHKYYTVLTVPAATSLTLADQRSGAAVGLSAASTGGSISKLVWSNNAALAILDYMLWPDGLNASLDEMDTDYWIAAANASDEQVALGSSSVCTADAATDVITLADAVPWQTGLQVRLTSTGELPGGLAATTSYAWVRLTPTTGYLASTKENALYELAVNITSAGTGTHTISAALSCTLDATADSVTLTDNVPRDGDAADDADQDEISPQFGWATGDAVRFFQGTPPAGLSLGVTYYWIRLTNASGKLAASFEAAIAGSALALADDGSGLTMARVSQPRYTVNGQVDLANKPIDNLEKLLTACCGTMPYVSGKYRLHVAGAVEPSFELGPSDLRGDMTIQPRPSKREVFNAVRGTYIDPCQLWESADLPPVISEQYQAEDGGEQIYKDVEFPFTIDAMRGQRLMWIILQQGRQGMVVDFPARLTAGGEGSTISIAACDVGQLIFPKELGWDGKLFRVASWTMTEDMAVDLSLQEYAAEATDWSPDMAAHADYAPNTAFANPWQVALPTSLVFTTGAAIYTYGADGTINPRLLVSWVAPADEYVLSGGRIELQLRESGTDTWRPAGTCDGSDTQIYLTQVQDGYEYDVRVRGINGIGAMSAWVQGSCLVVADPPAVALVENVACTIGKTGISVSFDLATDPWIRGYDVAVDDAPLVRGIGESPYLIPPIAAGLHTVQVRARDLFGQRGPWAERDVTVSAPGAPVVIAAIVGTGIQYDITPPAADFTLVGYIVRAGANWETGTDIGTITGSSDTRAAGAAGTVRRWFAAVDTAGNVGTPTAVDVELLAPLAPTVTARISGSNIEVAWVHNLGSLPLASSEILHGATLETATSLGEGLANTSLQVPGAAGSHRFWVRDTDSAGNPGPAGVVELVITAPGTVTITPQVIDNNVLLAWTENAGTLPLADCEIRRGATYAESALIGRINGRFSALFENVGGIYTYWITQRDIAGNEGTPAPITVQVSQPPDYVLHADMASAFTGGRTNTLSPTDHHSSMTVVGNVSTLNTAGAWRSARASIGVSSGKWYFEGTPVTQNTNYAMIGVGTSSASLAVYVGAAGGYGYYSFNGNKYLLGSALTYGTSYNDDDTIGVALDMDGGTLEFFKNGVSQGVAVTGLTGTLYPMVSLHNAIGDSWSLNFGESAFLYPMPAGYNGLTNALLDRGALILPVDTVSTVAERMAAGGWTTRQDKINAGYPYRMEPTPAGASYEEIIDYGTTLAGTKITVTQTSQLIHGSVALGCNIKTSQDAETWTDLGDVWTAYGTAFRYAQVTITATPDGGSNDLLRLTELRVRLDVKLSNDAGMAYCNAADVGGTQVNFNVGFVDIQSITLTPASGGAARFALYDFTDTANPTGFKILLYDASGNRVSGSCSWSAKGV